MRTTLSVIKADIGSIGGHLRPSDRATQAVGSHVREHGRRLVRDFHVGFTGDDIALLLTHDRGVGDPRVHELAHDAFMAATRVAKEQGLYGAGQDLLRDAFAGNVRGLGPASCEMEIEERPGEPFLLFAADKTEPGAYNLPLYLAFADPMHCPGLILSPRMARGFTFTIMDVAHSAGDRVIELKAPEELYDIASLLRDNQRFVVESIRSRLNGEIAAVISASRLRADQSGVHRGKDDPVALVRSQAGFPSTGEILGPYRIGHYVPGTMRGSHHGPLMPVRLNSTVSFFDGPAVVSCAAFCVHEGRLTDPVDAFDHPFWDWVRNNIAAKAAEIRAQGFSGPAMQPTTELEYGGVAEKLEQLERRFIVRKEEPPLPGGKKTAA